MISCTEFIPAYSDLFKKLEDLGGIEAVEDFWNYLSENFLTDLHQHVKEKGLKGCWDYWGNTLNEEAADFTMELDEEKGLFQITMHHCPSKGRLLELDHIEPYHDYCRHCDVLYRNVLEPLGFEYNLDMSECDQARCVLTVREKIEKK